jgi:hypothetical protein
VLDSFFIKKFFNIGVLKLHAIVTSHFLNFQLKFILSSSNKLLDYLLHFTFIMQKGYSSETRIIINNNKIIFVTTNAY